MKFSYINSIELFEIKQNFTKMFGLSWTYRFSEINNKGIVKEEKRNLCDFNDFWILKIQICWFINFQKLPSRTSFPYKIDCAHLTTKNPIKKHKTMSCLIINVSMLSVSFIRVLFYFTRSKTPAPMRFNSLMINLCYSHNFLNTFY